MKTQKFSLRKLKGFGLVGATIATMFLAQSVAADTQAEATPAQPTVAQVQPTESQVDTSAETFNKRLDAIEAYIKQDVANNLNESMTTAVNSYNSIDANNQVTAPKVTADDVTLTYDRSKFELTDDYKFTKSPVTISYNVANNDYMDTYSKMQPSMTNIKNLVADPIVLGTTPKNASEPKAIDDNNTMITVTRGTRTINYRFQETGNTALASIKQILTFYSPFVTPKTVHNQLSPSTDKTEAKETRFETVEGVTIKDAVKGFVEAPTVIADKYQYTGQTKMNDAQDILTYLYTTIEHSVPGEAPILDKPEYKIESEVPKDAPILDKPELKINETVPGNAPIAENPVLLVTRYVDEKGVEIKQASEGFTGALQTIGEYEFTGKTELNEGKDVQTHVYKHVVSTPQKPEVPLTNKVTPKTEVVEIVNHKNSQPTKVVEKQAPVQSTKENDSNATDKVDEKTPVKADKQLPHTGTVASILSLIGVALLFVGRYLLKKKNV